MTHTGIYLSPLGEILLAETGGQLTGLWFAGQKYLPENLPELGETTPVLRQAVRWLDAYFSGKALPECPPLAPNGTDFQKRVWAVLSAIPYGKTVTYGEIAISLGIVGGSRAVGSAVGRNPISLLIPCHRVVGTNGKLTGYAAGLEKKVALLKLEQDTFHF